MGSIGVSAVHLIDKSGDPLDNGAGELQVVLNADAAVNIGDVDLEFNGTAASVDEGNADSGTLRITLADDDNLLENIPNVIGTDGSSGPSKCISIAGTSGVGAIQEIKVDNDGELQVDVMSAPSTAVTNVGTFAVQSTLQASDGVDIGDVDVASLPADTFVAEDGALGKGVLMQGDDGSDRHNVLVDGSGRLRIDIAASSGGVLAVGNIGTFAVQSTLQANSGVDIGDVDVTSISAGTNAIGKVGHDITGMVHGIHNDVDATAVQLDDSIDGSLDVACKRVDLQALRANSGIIYVGGSNAIGPLTGGIELYAGDFYSIDIDNLNDIWIEASVANQALKYIYYT